MYRKRDGKRKKGGLAGYLDNVPPYFWVPGIPLELCLNRERWFSASAPTTTDERFAMVQVTDTPTGGRWHIQGGQMSTGLRKHYNGITPRTNSYNPKPESPTYNPKRRTRCLSHSTLMSHLLFYGGPSGKARPDPKRSSRFAV